MTDIYTPHGYSYEETRLLIEHDRGETLHAFVSCPGYIDGGSECEHWAHADDDGPCQECGDDSSGLMHNNTWRNTEPLMEDY